MRQAIIAAVMLIAAGCGTGASEQAERIGANDAANHTAAPATNGVSEQAARERAAAFVRRTGGSQRAETVSLRLTTLAELAGDPGLPAALYQDVRHDGHAPIYLARVHAPGAVASNCPCNPDAAVAADWWYVVLDAADGLPLTWAPVPLIPRRAA